MAITFTHTPVTRNPGVFAEFDPSKANTAVAALPTLIVAQMLSTGTAQPNVPVLCPSVAQGKALGGAGSQLALMVAQYLSRDAGNSAPLWVLPLADNQAGTQAARQLTFSGAATAAGTLNLYVAGQLLQVLVPSGMTAAQLAAAVAAQAALQADLPATAVAAAVVVTFTAKHRGADAGDLDLRLNYRGAAGGEALPPGIGAAVGLLAAGTANPLLAPALANLGDRPFAFVVLPCTDSANLDAVKAFLDEITGRWSPTRLIFGHGFGARRAVTTNGAADLTETVTFLATRNDGAVDVMPFYNAPQPGYVWAADLVGSIAESVRNDPGVPLQYLPMGVLPPPPGDEWDFGERNTLEYSGGSTFQVTPDGTVQVSRLCTTYQRNAAGAPDDSYLDTETRFQLAEVVTYLRDDQRTVFTRKKLFADGDRFGASNVIVTPAIVRAHMIAEYRKLERLGKVGNSKAFAAGLVVEKAGTGRLAELLPITIADQLRQIAMLVQFDKGA